MARLLATKAVHTRFSVVALIAFACSVYEAPPDASPPDVSAGEAGKSKAGTAGSVSAGSSSDPGGRAADGGSSAAGNAGSGGGSATVAGTSSGGTGVAPRTEGGAAGALGGESGAGQEGLGGESGAPPVSDDCPDDPAKLKPGTCGCGIPDTATATLADCTTVKKKLIHRYDFEGTGTTVTDRIGTAHGTVKGASLSKLDGKGVVLLGGGTNGPYVDLPNKLVSALTSTTIEAWITWGGGDAWQRIFDFGDTTVAMQEDTPGTGHTYLFATPKSAAGVAAAAFSLNTNSAEQDFASTVAVPLSLTQVSVVVNDAANKISLYVDGKKAGEGDWTSTLASLNDINVWLGRSQWNVDPEFNGIFHEFRIYNAALTDAEVATTFKAGTDPAFLKY